MAAPWTSSPSSRPASFSVAGGLRSWHASPMSPAGRKPYTNPRLLAHLARVKADMVARGEWRGIPLPGGPPPAQEEPEAPSGCDGCGRDVRLVDVPRRDRPTVRLCEACLDKWNYSHRWRTDFLARLDAAPSRRGAPPRR